MKQKGVFTNWRQTLIYSIESDMSAEYEADKIVFESLRIKSLLSEFQNSEQALIYGFYGCAKQIEKEISEANPDIEPLIFENSCSKEKRGKIILIQNDQVIMPCLILPESFFLKKPIDEKSIELTLFRILQDITHTVVACLSDRILQEWYKGKNIPFSDLHYTKFTQYKLELNDDENFDFINTSVNNLIPSQFGNWELLPNSNNQQQFLLYYKTHFTDKNKLEFQKQLQSFFQTSILTCFKDNQSTMSNNLSDYLNPDYQTQTIINLLKDWKEEFKKNIKLQLQDTEKKLSAMIKTKKSNLNDCQVQEIKNNYVTFLKEILTMYGDFIKFDRSRFFPTVINSIDVSSLQFEFSKITDFYSEEFNKQIDWIKQNKIPNIIDSFEKEINKNIIRFQLCKLSAIRETNTENSISRLTLNATQQFQIDTTELQPKQGIFGKLQSYYDKFVGNEEKEFSVQIIDYFTTKYDNYSLLIVQKDQTYNVLLLGKNGYIRTLTTLEHFSHPLFLYQKEQATLFGFNHRTSDPIKLKFNEAWKPTDQMIYYECQKYILAKVIFLAFDSTFIGLSKCGDVFKWKGNNDKFIRIKCQIFDEKNAHPQTKNFKPTQNCSMKYTQLEACPSGKRFLLSNQHVIDIYDMNYKLVKTIDLQSKFVLFADDFDCFILPVNNQKPYFQNINALTIPNILNRQKIRQINIDVEKQKKVGNPFFDIIRGSQVKYGPVSSFLKGKELQKIDIYIKNQQERENDIVNYLNQIQIQETCRFDFQFNLNQPKIIEEQEICSFLRFAYTRVPLQFCTIENNCLTPLIEGFRQNLESNQSLTVPQRARLLKLGYIEDYLMNLNEKIYVISIIGRQSSGKSYLLNRLFGTRFTVAASRCTDGIWASIVELEQTKFLILDCEGLFSPQRTKNEETYLLAFLAAVCDVTILNQDLSFNRHLDELLDNLTNAVGKLTGDSLFKGTLLIALRDITQKDSAGAQEQLLQNIGAKVKKRNSSFLNTLFSDSFNIYLFSHFEHKDFPTEIEDVREKFMQFADKSNRWLAGKELIQTIKILLIQLQTQDDENTDDLHFRFQIDNIVDKLKGNWIKLEEDLRFNFQEKEYVNKSYVFWEVGNDQDDFVKFWEDFTIIISKDLQLEQDVSSHNLNIIVIQEFIKVLVTQRKSFLLNQFEIETKAIIKSEIETEVVKHQRTIFTRYLDEQEQLYSLCQMQCSSCYLNCSKMVNHSNHWQSQINQKDSQLQTILKKFDNAPTSLVDNEQQIEFQKQFEKQQTIKADDLEKSIHYLQEYQKLLFLQSNMQEVQNKLTNHALSDTKYISQINFIKLLWFYNNLNLFKLKDEEEELKIEPKNEDYISVKQLCCLLQKKQKQFEVEFREITKKFENSKNQLKQNTKQIDWLNQQKPKDIQIKQNLLNLIEVNEKEFIQYQRDIQIQKEKTDNLQIKHETLSKALISKKFIQGEEKQDTQINEMQKVEQFFQSNINQLNNQFKSLKDKIININKELENPDQKRKEFSKLQLENLNQKTDSQFLLESKQSAENYQSLKQQLTELQQLELEINSQIKKFKNSFSYEIKKLQKKFKFLDEQKFQSTEEITAYINSQKQGLSQQLQKLCEQDIELVLEILKTEKYDEKNQDQFKNAFLAKKIEEWDLLSADQRLQKLEQLNNLQKEQEMLQQQINESSQQLEFIQLTIKFKIELNELKSQQERINQRKKQQIENQEQLSQISKILEKRDQELLIQTQKQESILGDIKTFEETLNRYQDRINILKEKNTIIEIFEGLVAYQNNLQNDIEKQNNVLKDWEQINQIKDNSLTQQNVSEIINQQLNELHELQENLIQIRQQIDCLIIQNRDLLLIQQLEFQLDELRKEEKEQHSCLRASHICDQQCLVCKDTLCTKIAGHPQDHLCDLPKHYCTQFCSIKLCDKECRKLFQHDGQHTCENPHYCKLPCQFCGADCQFEQQVEHDDHYCSLRGCIQKCSLCARSCLQEHSHSRLEGDVHFCENIHSCSQQCTLPGVCVWEYLEEKRQWKSSISSFEYTYFKLIDGGKQSCTLSIEPTQLTHGNDHSCKVEAHRCGAKCPECDGLCTKSYGHDGFHFAKQHRNKDSQIFTLIVGQGKEIQFGDNLEICKYQVGESSCPETCSESCSRRSRAHFHLMQCEGGEKCLEKVNKFARHQKEKYQGFEDIEFDEVQCVEFWKLQQWEHPIFEGDKLASIQGCNYFCPYCPSTNKKYCKLPAWHSFSKKYDDHEFWCYEEHQVNEFNGLDIVFVIDTTGSMCPMIEDAKEMIIQIMKQAKLSAGKNIRFGIVAYRDHPPQDLSYITKIQQIGNEHQALKFLNELNADGGGDYPEAVLDGLQEAIKLSWNSDYDKMIFLIGDAPPHGKQYSNKSSWPEGCPCGIRESNLFRQMELLQIQFKILALNSGLNLMILKFQEYIDLEVLDDIDGISFVSQVVDKVCQQIEMREITYRKI